MVAAHIFLLVLFLEMASAVLWSNVVSSTQRARFEDVYGTSRYYEIPHPFLQYVTGDDYKINKGKYLSLIGRKDPNTIYIVAMGGSTTAKITDGWPEAMENYLNRKLSEENSSSRAVVFNFGTVGWSSVNSIQNYFLLLKYLPPDFVIIHHNINDRRPTVLLADTYLNYPEIGPADRWLIRTSRFYGLATYIGHIAEARLLGLKQTPAYNPGGGDSRYYSQDLSMHAKISAYIVAAPRGWAADYFSTVYADYRPLLGPNNQEELKKYLLSQNYQSLIDATKAQHVTLILTTQYLNYSKNPEETSEELAGDVEHYRLTNDLIRELGLRNNVTVVDLDRGMTALDPLLRDSAHWKEEGITFKGETVGRTLLAIMDSRNNGSGSH